MENASKALLITAAVLVAIILIALGVKIFSSSVDTTSQAETIGKVITDKGKSATAIIAESLGKAGGSSLGGGTTVDGTISGEIVSGVATTGVWTDNGDGTFSKGETKVAIGDYVNYNEAGSGNWTADTSKGAGRKATFNLGKKYDITVGNPYTTENLGWRVLGVNNKGELELISDRPHTEILYLANEEGYLNAKDVLNGFCNTLYGKGTDESGKVVATEARSLNVDDINKLGNYDPTTYSGYGKEWIYRYPTEEEVSGTRYMQYSINEGTTWNNITSSSYQEFRMPGSNTTISVDNPGIQRLTYNYYKYTLSDRVKQITSDGKDMLDIILKGTLASKVSQWLASRTIFCGNSCVGFYVQYVSKDGYINNCYLYGSNVSYNMNGLLVRPVVTLKSDVQLSGNSADGWTIS